MTTSSSKPRFGRKAKLALLLFTTIGIVLLGEIALTPFRVFAPYPRFDVGERTNRDHPWFVPDETLGWKIRSDAKGINARGFRGPLPGSDVKRRVAIVGDSFSYGADVEYEDTFAAILDAELPDTGVANFSMLGYGIDQVWLAAKYEALPIQPDLIIVGLCDADLKRSQSAFRPTEGLNKPVYKLVDGQLVPKTSNDRLPQPFHFLERHSRLWQAGRQTMQYIGYHYPVGEWWTLNQAILDRLQADCQECEVPVLFVHIPTVDWRGFPTLDRYMREKKVNYISLQEDALPDPSSLYLLQTPYPHLNPKGHRFVADKIMAYLEQHPSLLRPKRGDS